MPATTSRPRCCRGPSRCSTSSSRGVEGGAVPAASLRPLSTFFRIDCHTCDPDGLGTAELRKQWDRKRHDPALRAYAELAEPVEEPATA